VIFRRDQRYTPRHRDLTVESGQYVPGITVFARDCFMANQTDVVGLIEGNQLSITRYYRTAIVFLCGVMLAHVVFAGYLLIRHHMPNPSAVLAFAAFNATVIVVETMLGRITFMLASRSGQLLDLRMILAILGDRPDTDAFERTARVFMLLRRDRPSTLRLFDVERLAATLPKLKG